MRPRGSRRVRGYRGRCIAIEHASSSQTSRIAFRPVSAHLASQTDDGDPFILSDKDALGALSSGQLSHPFPRLSLIRGLRVRVDASSFETGLHPLDRLLVQLEREVESLGHGGVGNIVLASYVSATGSAGIPRSVNGLTWVGPIPPEQTTKSYFSVILLAASTISCSSSAMISILLSSIPRSKHCLAKKLLFESLLRFATIRSD